MSAKYLYNLYDTWDDNRIVLEKAALADVMEFTGLKNIKIAQYIDKGNLLCKRYRPERAGACEKKGRTAKREVFTAQMYREWKTMNERYGKKTVSSR